MLHLPAPPPQCSSTQPCMTLLLGCVCEVVCWNKVRGPTLALDHSQEKSLRLCQSLFLGFASSSEERVRVQSSLYVLEGKRGH
ncbi:hypothetical protein SRHO_G00159570 [Serrasalmus rhombeus]